LSVFFEAASATGLTAEVRAMESATRRLVGARSAFLLAIVGSSSLSNFNPKSLAPNGYKGLNSVP
jgi:hypothetical protein